MGQQDLVCGGGVANRPALSTWIVTRKVIGKTVHGGQKSPGESDATCRCRERGVYSCC